MDPLLPAIILVGLLLSLPVGFLFVWLDEREGQEVAQRLEARRIARDWAAKNR